MESQKRTVPSRLAEARILPSGEKIEAKLIPAKKVDLGDGPGKEMIVNLTGGQVGVIFDTRGRPLKISTNEEERIKSLKTWHESLKLYPE